MDTSASLHDETTSSSSVSKDVPRTDEKEFRPSKHTSLDIATITTLSTAQAASADDIATKRSEYSADNWTASIQNVTRKQFTLKEFEDIVYDKMCNSSCKDNCGQYTFISDSKCYCDDACLRLGDCCLDYEASCLSGPKVTRDNYAAILRKRKPPSVKCVEIRRETPQGNTLLMVSSCARSKLVTSTDTNYTIDLCEGHSVQNKTIATETPVMFRGVIYRNKYCAICNNPGNNLTNMITAAVLFKCANTTGTFSEQWQRQDSGSRHQEDISNCELQFNLSYIERLLHNNGRYNCRMENSATNLCNANVTYPWFDVDNLRATCQKYQANIYDISLKIPYRNPHCAMCRGVKDPSNLACSVVSEEMDMSMGIVSQIVETPFIRYSMCHFDLVFDHATGMCFKPTCPAGHARLRDKRCVKVNVTVPQLFSGKSDIRTYVAISSESYVDIEPITYAIGCVDSQQLYSDCITVKVFKKWNVVISNISTCCIQETLSRNFSEVVFKILTYINSFKDPSHLPEQQDIFAFNRDTNETSETCLKGSLHIRGDLIFLGDREVYPSTFPSMFKVPTTSQMYSVTEVPVILSWRMTNPLDKRLVASSVALVCEPDILSCDTVTFQADEYTNLGDSLLLYEGTPREIEIAERSVLRLESEAIVFCSTLLANVTGIPSEMTGDMLVQDRLTMTGNILSMVCLTFTMITYCMFEQIRTRAGKCVMNLCGALFCAQLSMLVSDGLVSYREACVVVAVAQHYAWLVSFLWMNVLAFDVSCVFADMKLSRGTRSTRRLVAFAVYAWGLPAVFVAVCVALAFYTDLPFSYRSKKICWISGPLANVYYFIAPVAAAITANAILFVRTVIALRHSLSVSSKARPERHRRSAFVIYIRLTSLMGFTWLFGFLANVEVLSFLLYPFIICNSCQGVFICASFSLTSRVRGMWRERFCVKHTRNTSDGSTSVNHATSPPHYKTTRL